MNPQVELKRVVINNWTIDIGWCQRDLVFHFYGPPARIRTIDSQLDPIYKEIFSQPIIDKNKLLNEVHNSVANQFKGDEVREDVYETSNFIGKLRAIETIPGIHKAWTDIETSSQHHRGMVPILSWSYVLKRADTMFLEQKVELLFKKLESIF